MNRLHTLAVERAGLPRVTLAQRVVDKMVLNALTYETETGESLIGLPVSVLGRLEPDLYVLDTVAPDDSAVRRHTYFEQGDDLQSDILNWLADSWNDYRKQSNSKLEMRWNVPLDHLGDWHKHPGTLTEPSWGDTETALNHVLDKISGKPYLLAILATVWEHEQAHATDEAEKAFPSELPLKIDIDPVNTVRLDCWYMSRRTRRFVQLSPKVQPNSELPTLPLVSWHLSQPQRAREEVERLGKAGYAVSIDEWDTDHQAPREICLTLARRGSETILIVITQANYPARRPLIRTVPMSIMKSIPENTDLFPELWKASQPLPESAYPGWEWTAERTICDLAQAIEEKVAH